MQDNRHWPAAAKPGAGAAAGSANAAEPVGQRAGLTLEALHLGFEENVYWAAPGERWFEWGVAWGHHQSYGSLAEFQVALAIDRGSRTRDPGFADALARDYRLTREAMEKVAGAYPQGPVPGVRLGLRP